MIKERRLHFNWVDAQNIEAETRVVMKAVHGQGGSKLAQKLNQAEGLTAEVPLGLDGFSKEQKEVGDSPKGMGKRAAVDEHSASQVCAANVLQFYTKNDATRLGFACARVLL